MGWLRRIGIGLLVLAVVAVAWEPTRVGIQTAVLLPNLLDAGPKPLSLFSEAPQRTAVEYRPGTDGADPELAELWLPSWASPDERAGGDAPRPGRQQRRAQPSGRGTRGRRPGAHRRGGPRARLAGPARGAPGGGRGRRRRARLRAPRRAARRSIPSASGSSGSASAARSPCWPPADPRIADEVRWVNAFGAFADAATYLAAVSAHAYRDRDDGEVPWTPSPLAREIYLRFMLDQVADPDDRAGAEAVPSAPPSWPPSGRRPTRCCAPRSRPTPHARSTTC